MTHMNLAQEDAAVHLSDKNVGFERLSGFNIPLLTKP